MPANSLAQIKAEKSCSQKRHAPAPASHTAGSPKAHQKATLPTESIFFRTRYRYHCTHQEEFHRGTLNNLHLTPSTMNPRLTLIKICLSLIGLCCSLVCYAQTIYLVGDSTVANFELSDPRQGWGQVIAHDFSDKVTVKNYALSGRSSKSYLEEGAWAPVLAAIHPGDYVLIQFGHNDEKRDAARATEPYGSYQTYLSRYVDETLKAGGIPILITPVSRGGFKHSGSHGDYPKAMIDLAQMKKIACIDLTQRSAAYFSKIGQMATYKLFIASIDGKDDTHFTPAGAEAIAKLVAAGIRELEIPLSQEVVSQD